MSNNIVDVNVSQTVAPTPSTLQQMAAIVSQGATTLAVNDSEILTQLSDLTPILKGALSVTGIVRSSSTATATTAAPHGYPISEVVALTIAGAVQPQYNGVQQCTITGASTFTFTVSGTPTTPATGTIVWTPEDVIEVLAAVTTWFGQGSGQAVYVLELGEGNAADGVTALTAYLTANPNSQYTSGAQGYFYAYRVPDDFAAEPTYLTLIAAYESPTSKTYFWTQMTLGNYSSFTNLMKNVFGLVSAPAELATVDDVAAALFWWVSNRPSATNKVPPFAFTFLFGPTPYPTKNNGTTLANLLAANVNYVGTGAEGGISTAILRNGTMMDGRGASYWYSLDWIQINVKLNIAAAVINGSNDKINPLYFNQDGINRLQKIGANTLVNAVTFGMANGQVVQTALDGPAFAQQLDDGAFNGMLVINAVPFIPYNLENPGDYKIGEYDGFSIVYITQDGFIHILFDVNVTDLIAI